MLARTGSVYLIRGSLFHQGLAHYYQRKIEVLAGNDPEQWLPWRAAVAAQADAEGAGWLHEIPLVTEAIEDYLRHWSQDGWKPLLVEYELRAQVKHPTKPGERFLYTQRADLIVEDKDQRVWIVDHKTASRIAGRTLAQHTLSGQMIGYQHFGRALYGERFAGVLLNRVKLQAPQEYDRRPVQPAPWAVRNFIKTLQWAEQVDDMTPMDPDLAPMAVHQSVCYGSYGACDAHDLCRFGT